MTITAERKYEFDLPNRRWSLEEYHAMIDAGILTPDDKVELLFGNIVPMNAVGAAHGATANIIAKHLFRRLLDTETVIGVQNPITLLNDSEPEPDLYVATGPQERYLDGHPTAADVLLVIEVSDSTLARDTDVKKVNYALANVREYWVVDVYNRLVIRHVDPEGGDYATIERYEEGQTFESLAAGRFRVEDLLVQYPE